MTVGFTTRSLQAGIAGITASIKECAAELNEKDGALGDGDLGVTMLRGVLGLEEEAGRLPEDVGLALLRCSQVMTKVSGSTYGTLMATGLMNAAKATKGRTLVPWQELPQLLGNALAAMATRARSQVGEKTVLDSIEAVRRALEGLDDPGLMAEAAEQAAAGAMDEFRQKPARQGRARIFAEKSVGLDDPGMLAFKRIIEGIRAGK
ncbi:MAG TPA: dihydroxyacetone kinase subunit L [Acidobacteriota bacterium]|nr:dihydroxyacetone kinase subunit L [Acidobacteriota bacterium]